MKNLLLLTLLFTIYSCSFGKIPKGNSNDFLEGEIVYHLDYQPYSDQFSAKRLKENIGSKMVLTFKEGSSRKRYYYSKRLSVDPLWYTNYREGNFNEIIKIGKGIHLLSINKGV